MPLYKVAETVQPEQEMYDYVIIDEASQLGPDAIFLLYISKNIIIVGDDKQTSPEYVGVDSNAMTPYIKRYLNDIPFSNYYGTEFSFFDLAKFFCDGVIVLREHFRCMPEIIEFSNKYFYAPDGKGLYPLKQYSENRLEPLVPVFCPNGFTVGVGSQIINEPEANQIVENIGRLILDVRYNNKSIGIITLQGNQQSSLIESLLLKRIGEKEFHKRKIVCGNSASFQGDERDIIFLSLVTAHNHNRLALVKPEDERRFNVAVSRAKEQIQLFHSVQLEDLSNNNDLRYKLLDHFKNYSFNQHIINLPIERQIGTQPEPFDSWFEVDVYNDIVSKQLKVIPQYEVAKGKYRIDLVAILLDGTKIAIECDGDKWHGADAYQNDLMRQKVLERCGWQFFRVRGYEYYTNRTKALKPLWDMIPIINKAKEDVLLTETINIKENSKRDLFEIKSENFGHKSNRIISEKLKTKEFIPVNDISNFIASDIIRYFNLYNSGLYILTDDKPLEADFVIAIKSSHRLGFLLQCYKSGHINKVHISVLLSKKIKKEYLNGYNPNSELIYLMAIESEKIIGIYFNENGKRKFKAHLTEKISSRELLQLQGYKVIYNDFEKIEYKILPLEMHNQINRLVFKSFTSNGKAIDNKNYELEWISLRQFGLKNIINQPKIEKEIIEVKDHYTPNNLFDIRVELNSIVKIKFLNNDKILIVKLVNYFTDGNEIIDGVQIIHNSKPLAMSINGKNIGDIVKVGSTDNLVKIIEIN